MNEAAQLKNNDDVNAGAQDDEEEDDDLFAPSSDNDDEALLGAGPLGKQSAVSEDKIFWTFSILIKVT